LKIISGQVLHCLASATVAPVGLRKPARDEAVVRSAAWSAWPPARGADRPLKKPF
jgi:hypothetical protein